MFGLSLPAVVTLLEHLPTSAVCSLYRFRFHTALEAAKLSLPINESGCAKGEPHARKRPAVVVVAAAREMEGGAGAGATNDAVSVERR